MNNLSPKHRVTYRILCNSREEAGATLHSGGAQRDFGNYVERMKNTLESTAFLLTNGYSQRLRSEEIDSRVVTRGNELFAEYRTYLVIEELHDTQFP